MPELKLNLDPGDLSLAEVRDIEDKSGKPISTVIEDLKSLEYNMDEVIAVLWVLQRREDPGFTFEDAENLKLSEIDIQTS